MNIIHIVHYQKNQTHMINSTENPPNKTQHPFVIKTLNQLETEGFFELIKESEKNLELIS